MHEVQYRTVGHSTLGVSLKIFFFFLWESLQILRRHSSLHSFLSPYSPVKVTPCLDVNLG